MPQAWPVYRLGRAPADVRAARPPRGLPGHAGGATSAARPSAIGRRRAILVEPRGRGARRARRCRCAGRRPPPRPAAASSPASASTPAPRPPRRSMAAWARLALPGDRRLHRRPQPRLLAAEPDLELGQRPDRRRLAPDPDLRRPAGADQRLLAAAPSSAASQATAQGDGRGDRRGRPGGAPSAMGPGSPIYFDMEAYTRTSSATAATLAFLEAWTEKLHALGYVSGVYSSSASGIADLADQIGTGYDLPDDLWFANWNGQPSTADPYVPANAWTPHQRIHQYRGGHDETYGGVTINIDNNYVDGADGRHRRRCRRRRRPGRLPRPGRRPRAGPGAGEGLGLRPQRADRSRWRSALFVGGRAGRAERARLRPRPGRQPSRAATSPPSTREAGPRHGFDVSLPTVKSGRAAGLRLRARRRPRRRPPARLQDDARSRSRSRSPTCGPTKPACRCGSPAPGRQGTACPGQLALRTRFKVAGRRDRGRGRRDCAPCSRLARAQRLPADRRAARRPSRPAQRRRPGAAAPARQAAHAADRRDPRRPPGRRPRRSSAAPSPSASRRLASSARRAAARARAGRGAPRRRLRPRRPRRRAPARRPAPRLGGRRRAPSRRPRPPSSCS